MSKQIKITQRINVPLYRVWRYFNTSVGIASWFPEQGAMLEPKAGGRLRLLFSDGAIDCEMVEFIPGKRFSYRWNTGGMLGALIAETNPVFELSEELTDTGKPYTIVKFQETGFGDTTDWMEYYAQTYAGWTMYLLNLKSICEGGLDLRSSVRLCYTPD
ncbi:MAG: SRPBCC domain-containing protein [bacterium]|nr:SRPBCC domain-containing protein [bacterium]